jgi:hypothetical protein
MLYVVSIFVKIAWISAKRIQFAYLLFSKNILSKSITFWDMTPRSPEP